MNNMRSVKKYFYARPKTTVFFGLLALNLILYANAIGSFFISDDFDWLLSVQKPLGALMNVFAGNYYGEHAMGGTFRPMVAVFFYLSRLAFGLNPAGYHVIQILIHAGAAYLVYLIALKLFEGAKRAQLISLGSALLFSIMPSHVEAVSWISAIGDPLATLFYLGCLNLFIECRMRNARCGGGKIAGMLGLFILALLTKETAITLPFALLAYELFIKKNFNIRSLSRILYSSFIVLFAYLAYRYWAIGVLFGYYRRSSLAQVIHFDQYARTFANMVSSMFFAGQTRIDFGNLLVHYWYLSVILVFGLLFALIAYMKGRRNMIFFLAGFWVLNIGLILPLSLGINNDEGQRYAYLPSVAFCILAAWLFGELFESYRWKMIAVPIAAGLFWLLLQHILVNQWAIAGSFSKQIYDRLPSFDFQKVEKTYVVGLPESYLNAQLFRNGFTQSLALRGIDSSRVERVPIYVRLNDVNRSGELYGQRVEYDDGFLWETHDRQYIVTGNATEEHPDYHFELWGYNYANATADHIRMYFADPDWKKNAQVIYFDEGKLQAFSF